MEDRDRALAALFRGVNHAAAKGTHWSAPFGPLNRAAVSARIDNDRVYEALKPGDIVEFKEDIVFDFKPQPVTLRELFVQSAGRSLRFAGRKHDGSLFNCKLRRKTIQENPIVCVR